MGVCSPSHAVKWLELADYMMFNKMNIKSFFLS